MKSECKELTQEQLSISNGCGSSYWLLWIFRIPKWVSHDFWCACSCHDIQFQSGKTLQQKYKADDKLYDDMYYSAFHSSILKKWIKLQIADLVYWALSTKLSDIAFEKAKPKKFYFN